MDFIAFAVVFVLTLILLINHAVTIILTMLFLKENKILKIEFKKVYSFKEFSVEKFKNKKVNKLKYLEITSSILKIQKIILFLLVAIIIISNLMD